MGSIQEKPETPGRITTLLCYSPPHKGALVKRNFQLYTVLFIAMGFIGWFLWQIVGHGPRERERRQRELKEETQRTNLLIQTHMAAHRLMDTPQNRAHVLQLLSKPATRGRRR